MADELIDYFPPEIREHIIISPPENYEVHKEEPIIKVIGNIIFTKSYTEKATSRFPPDNVNVEVQIDDLNIQRANIKIIEKKGYLFSWNDIPGNDNGILIEFLNQNFGIDWTKTALIQKIDNNKTIKVFTEKNQLLLKLNDDQPEVILEIDDGRTDTFDVKYENGKINIYETGDEVYYSYECDYSFKIDKSKLQFKINVTVRYEYINTHQGRLLIKEKKVFFKDVTAQVDYPYCKIIDPQDNTAFYIQDGVSRILSVSVNAVVYLSGPSTLKWFLDGVYLFSWEDIQIDNEILIKFLKQRFDIDWVNPIVDTTDKTIIKVSTEKNHLSLKLDDKHPEVILEIDDGRTEQFVVKIKNEKHNIYTYANRANETFDTGDNIYSGTKDIEILRGEEDSHKIKVTCTDNDNKTTDSNIVTILMDNTPPTIIISEPEENKVIEKKSDPFVPFNLTVKGTVEDSQSGFESLKYLFGGKTPVTVDDKGEWTFELRINKPIPYTLIMIAEDKSGNPGTVYRHFDVVKSYKSKKIDELLSPVAYLNELLDFSSSHLLTEDGALNTDPILIDTFCQPFGELAQSEASTPEQSNIDLFAPVKLLRAKESQTTPLPAPIKEYHRAAYEALLIGLGTSYEEIRMINALPADKRTALAARLGLMTPDETLENLLPTGILFGLREFEEWLEGTFGFPSTIPLETNRPGLPWVLQQRRKSIALQWEVTPQGSGQMGAPFLDPDMVDPEDLSPTASDWYKLLNQRRSQLEKQHTKLMGETSIYDALMDVFDVYEITHLLELEASEQAGNSIEPDLTQLSLTLPMFRRLMGYRSLEASLKARGAELSLREKEDTAHLLTQVWKLRKCYSAWREEESPESPDYSLSTRLWPSQQADAALAPAWEPGHYKRNFLPWRGNTQARSDLESLLAGRIRDWQTLDEGQASMVTEAQRATLPALRDGLLGMGDLPSADDLTERWLVDFAATGATCLTPIEQATITLQSLINGIRNKRFETGHPASLWTINPHPDFANTFDEEWKWLGSYGTWRSARMNYSYPENVLYPELLPSPNFKTFLAELRKLQPLTDEKLIWIKGIIQGTMDTTPVPKTYQEFREAFNNLEEGEIYYFAPVAIALTLQRARMFTLALDWYRLVYDTSLIPRKRVEKLRGEKDYLPPSRQFDDIHWTKNLTDPHAVATAIVNNTLVFGNPYTRYTLMQIVLCMLSQAEMEFAAGTLDSRSRALALYLETKEILAFDELKDLEPAPGNPRQSYLPNPIFAAQRAQVEVSLRKLRGGLSFLGTPLPADPTRSAGGAVISSLVKPTPYRFKVLMERAKQLVAQAQQIEQQYLSAIVGGDDMREKFMRENFVLEIAGQTVALRTLYETEAAHGMVLAQRQKGRSEIQRNQYRNWIAAGPNEHETRQVEELWAAKTARDIIGGIDAVITAANAIPTGADKITPWQWAVTGVIVGAAAGRAITQGFLNANETQAQVSGMLASQERRRDEWELQQNLANQDMSIGDQQITLAQDRIDIAKKESEIASTQLVHAQQMVAFLTNKFTSVEFYDWLQGVLGDVYAFFLRISTSTAQQAELQLAFERQELSGRLIKSDYWSAASQSESSSNTASTPDRRGISGSARLLQDIYTLDQQAFNSERRLLNLSHTFSLARMMPIEFQEFRRTGVLVFATPLQLFDEGFPGHYMRLIKRVRLSVAALIPPNMGIRATLTNNGMSRVVTGGPAYQTVIVCQDPQSVALTSPSASTGVFELDMQTDLLYPFEGNGVDTTWFLELPPAGNRFDFDTIGDAVMTIEYTAQSSYDLRDRVIKQLSRKWSADQAFSVRQDLPDVWYDISNLSGEAKPSVELKLGLSDFPPGLSDHAVEEIMVYVKLKDGTDAKFAVQPARRPKDKTWADGVSGESISAVKGLASTHQSGAISWTKLRGPLVLPGIPGSDTQWRFVFSDIDEFSLAEALRQGDVEEILIVFTLSGTKPAWR